MKKHITKLLFASYLIIGTTSVQAQGNSIDKFQPTHESLTQYRFPDWFRDAKFGIWSHWGPQAVPRQGDWYAKKMYQEGSPVAKYHREHYGHPSEFGYKDIIPLWKAERFDPEKLMELYVKAGAKYFVSMGSHHDNFFLWDSKLNPWNAVQMGPNKDIVALWQNAAKRHGLKFGVSEHLGASYTWFQPSHGADSTGQYKGLPYDGANPKYQSLYHAPTAKCDKEWLTTHPTFQQQWLASINELVDKYHPDLLYSDSQFPFEETGLKMVSHFYNDNLRSNRGDLTAIYNCKEPSFGKWVQDVERGVMDSVLAYPWQTDTSIGDWYYRTGQKYKTAKEIIQMLCDIVSKNGNLLINVVQTPEGDIEDDMVKTLEEIGKWMAVNGEGIYSSRPWKTFGEKPPMAFRSKADAKFNEKNIKYTAEDVRFTTKGDAFYAYVLDVPANEIRIKSLGKQTDLNQKKIAKITLLGSKEKIKWQQADDALVIKKPASLPNWDVLGFKIQFAK